MKSLQLLGLIAIVSLASWSAAAASFKLSPTERAPAATGTVSASQGKGNTNLEIKLEHMARPSDLAPGLTTYVAWVVPGEGKAPVPVAKLLPDKKKNAQVRASTPFQGFSILVTAETTGTPATPSQYVVLRGAVDASAK
jgi:hypothetical protein